MPQTDPKQRHKEAEAIVRRLFYAKYEDYSFQCFLLKGGNRYAQNVWERARQFVKRYGLSGSKRQKKVDAKTMADMMEIMRDLKQVNL